jgi:predicted enzyme related to lactoylglutathione lyase
MAKVGYFEIQVDDFKRAEAFYQNVFGWTFSKIEAPFEYYMRQCVRPLGSQIKRRDVTDQ